jgi:2',3'-cyclic-nucleotide 2'-phosphodiesterase (5'-nucleotidase family)
MQPDAKNSTSGPRGPLELGQLNFIHTTDTHGWLEGHLKQQNYGADWRDFVSFTQAMKRKANSLGVDLLLVDTGVRFLVSINILLVYNLQDLHDVLG